MTINTDEFAGQGGSYMLDPATGQRTLVERTQDPAPAPAPAETPAENTDGDPAAEA